MWFFKTKLVKAENVNGHRFKIKFPAVTVISLLHSQGYHMGDGIPLTGVKGTDIQVAHSDYGTTKWVMVKDQISNTPPNYSSVKNN